MEKEKKEETEVFVDNEIFIARTIEKEDYEKGYFELINQLTIAPKLEKEEFLKILELNKNCIIIIMEDKKNRKLIGTVKILFDFKFARKGGIVAHLEDIVIDEDYRKNGYGTFLIKLVEEISQKKNCYKLVGSCRENFKEFYRAKGFDVSGINFTKYFK